MGEKMFEIMGDEHIKEIPWRVLNEEWAVRNHSQSLADLNDRGGLNVIEAYGNIKGIKWRDLENIRYDVAKNFLFDRIKAEESPTLLPDDAQALAAYMRRWYSSGESVVHGRPLLPIIEQLERIAKETK